MPPPSRPENTSAGEEGGAHHVLPQGTPQSSPQGPQPTALPQ